MTAVVDILFIIDPNLLKHMDCLFEPLVFVYHCVVTLLSVGCPIAKEIFAKKKSLNSEEAGFQWFAFYFEFLQETANS